ncbi:unnamed protein product [Rotaria magnacalcarata]|uniref:G-protein coupled receptors family 1 profile domain-containing protein n=3 Tax=Rotaria magnacalcarata TaxID=392030 RepID=A0A816N377_9BILA|nr:unnamed protein product [Rotaria magnacalcarata]CAF2141455.1 unnamed protein product [Rotaria magnacalcarata]CAF4111041.1 unnamed protein product [Rotaria magnacalcarata]CAF4114326.1 unnamed protein product [Rotaria magnacalcarata]
MIARLIGFAALTIITVLGNIIIVIAICVEPRLKSVSNYLIINLAVADFFVGTTVIPFISLWEINGKWLFGELLCNIWLCCTLLFCTVSFLTMSAIALDRYLYLIESKMNRKRRTVRRAFSLIILTWLIPAMVWIPGVIVHSYMPGCSPIVVPENGCYLQARSIYVLIATILLFFLPMIGMIVLYIKIFRVLHGQMSKLLVWLTEVKLNNGRRTSQTIVFDPLTGTGNETGGGRGPVSTASSTSNFHQQTARCTTIGSMNNINYIHHHHHPRMTTNYATMRTIKNVAAMETNKYRLTQQQHQQQQELLQTAHELPTSTKHKFRRAVHAIVWLGRARGSAGTNKGSFKEYRENSQARSNKKLFYTSAWSSAGTNNNPFRRARNSTYRRAMSTTDSLLHRQMSVARRQQQQKMRLAKQRRVARTLGVLIFVFLVSWLPFTILWPVQRSFGNKYVSNSLLRKTLWLTYANTFINPFLYFFSNNDFRYALRRILKCCFRQNGGSSNIQIK